MLNNNGFDDNKPLISKEEHLVIDVESKVEEEPLGTNSKPRDGGVMWMSNSQYSHVTIKHTAISNVQKLDVWGLLEMGLEDHNNHGDNNKVILLLPYPTSALPNRARAMVGGHREVLQ